jgi:amidohydrolase
MALSEPTTRNGTKDAGDVLAEGASVAGEAEEGAAAERGTVEVAGGVGVEVAPSWHASNVIAEAENRGIQRMSGAMLGRLIAKNTPFDGRAGLLERTVRMLQQDITRAIDDAVDQDRADLSRLAQSIYANPELRFEEVKAAGWIEQLVASRKHPVERGVGGMKTALRSRAGKAGGPRVAILAEYDALPEIGHACGHNLIAAGGVGAFLAAARVAEKVGGEVVLLGTPAEEGGGGKIRLIEAGAFEGFDAAMMFHPFDRDILAHPALASVWLTFAFKGRPAHAAAAPHEGNSALTACMDAFRLIDGQRVHFKDGVRVHGYVTNGGQAVNIIPEDAACEISVRARTLDELARVRAIVERCARGAAMASGVEVTIAAREGYKDMVNNLALARRFGAHLEALGRKPHEVDGRVGAGSTDMGDVSHVVPSIHPYLGIVDEGEALCHTHPFANAAASERGFEAAIVAAKALARTAIEVLADESLRRGLRAEWDARGS